MNLRRLASTLSFFALSLPAVACVAVYSTPGARPGQPGQPGVAVAQAEGAAPTGEVSPAAPTGEMTATGEPVSAPALPEGAAAPAPTTIVVAKEQGPTDHEQVIRRWGVQVRSLGAFRRETLGEACDQNCQQSLTSIGVRRWLSNRYAFDAGLAFSVAGGTGQNDVTYDTSFGVGPTLGASFLLANWKHLAISASPQLDVVYFAPRSDGNKTLLVNLRGLVEGELHLGFIGVSPLSVGIGTGIAFNLNHGSRADTVWSISTGGGSSFWGLVNNAFLRYYF